MTVLDEEAAFDREFEAKLASRRARRLASLGLRPVAWLALVPVWSTRLAHACQFPAEGQDLDAFLEQAEHAGLLRRREPPDPTELAWQRVEVWLRAVPGLPAPLIAEAIAAVAALEHDRPRIEALVVLAGLLPEAVLPAAADTAIRALADQAVDAALTVPAATARAETLLRLLPLLDKLAGGGGPDGQAQRERVLAALLPLTEAADVEPAGRCRILVSLAPGLSPEQLDAALAAARRLPDLERLEVLLALAPHLAAPLRQAALGEADQLAAGLTEPQARTLALAWLAPALADAGQHERAGQLAGAIAAHQVRVRVLAQVAGAARVAGDIDTASQVTQVLTDSAGTDPELRVRDLTAAAHGLAGVGDRAEAVRLAERALDAAGKLPTSAAASTPLSQVAMAVAETGAGPPGAAASAAVEAVHQLDDARARCQRLTDLLPYLAGAQRAAALDLALDAARAVDSGADRALALAGLLPSLPEARREPTLREALAALEQVAEEAAFWMPDGARAEVLADLLDELHRQAVLDLSEEMGEIARRLRRAGRELPLPADLARWVELTTRLTGGTGQEPDTGPEAAARFLDAKLTELVKVRDAEQAAAWVRAGTLLGQTIRGELEVIALNGMRRVELLHRQAQDHRHLARFLRRPEQVRAFEALLDGPDDRWALHYRGVAGVGKTMLLRHLTTEVTPPRGIPVSRIDFDHLSPDYPLRRPGQLLLELADELRSYVSSTRHDAVFQRMRATVVRVHEALRADQPPASDPLASLRREDFGRALRAFCGFLEQLPQPVVLILDTCEELAKLPPAGAILPALEATYQILERIHKLVPTVRVVFAGRRFLARAGDGWWLRASATGEARALLPEKKSYLRLHEIRGFDRDEAGRYLDRGGLTDRDLRKAVLAQSLEEPAEDEVDWDERVAPTPGPRYNPFVLSLFADWAREDPHLAPGQVASGSSDPYVEARIVGRLRDPQVQALLPAAVLLRRFDRAMLRPVFSGEDDAFEAAYRALGGMEWLDYQLDEALATTFLNVHPGLLRRLEAYYRHPDRRPLLASARDQLGPALAALVDSRPLDQLGVDHVDATLRLLPAGEAAEVWDRFARRVTEEAKWSWARQVTDRLLGEDGAVSARKHPLRAAVRALQCAIFTHEQPTLNLGGMWAEVEATARAHPDPDAREWLSLRAGLGRLAADADRWDRGLPRLARRLSDLWGPYQKGESDRPAEPLPGDPDGWRTEQLLASWCAAAEAVLERAERTGDLRVLHHGTLRSAWSRLLVRARVSATLRTAMAVGWYRALALTGGLDVARRGFTRALRFLPDPAEPRRQHWADWRAPTSIADRARLEAARLLPARGPTVVADLPVGGWWRSARARIAQVDAERLLSALLRQRLAWGVVPAEVLTELTQAEHYQPDRQATVAAHQAVPPLLVSVALGWLALGDGARALALLDERAEQAEATGRDPDTVRAAERAKLTVIRRQRLHDEAQSLVQRLADATELDDAAPAWAVLALVKSGGKGPEIHQLAGGDRLLHERWRTSARVEEDAALAAAGRLTTQLRDAVPATAAPKGLGQLLDQAAGEGHRYRMEWDAERPLRVQVDETTVVVRAPASAQLWTLALDWWEAVGLAPGGTLPKLPIGATWLRGQPDHDERIARLRLRASALHRRYADEYRAHARALASPGLSTPPIEAGELRGWAEGIGLRRMAELALDEGELLALRHPDEGTYLLGLAADWFQETGDAAGTLVAGIAASSAVLRSRPEVPDYQAQVQRVRAAYERFQGLPSGTGLPRWFSLDAVDRFPQRDWQGWLDRLAVVLAAGPGDEGVASIPSLKEVKRRLRDRYGSTFPVELEVAAVRRSTPAPRETPPAPVERYQVGNVRVASPRVEAPAASPPSEPSAVRPASEAPAVRPPSGPPAARPPSEPPRPMRTKRRSGLATVLTTIVLSLALVALVLGVQRALSPAKPAATTASSMPTATSSGSGPPTSVGCTPSAASISGLRVTPSRAEPGTPVQITANLSRSFGGCPLRIFLGQSRLGGDAIVGADGGILARRTVPESASPGPITVGLATTRGRVLATAPFEVLTAARAENRGPPWLLFALSPVLLVVLMSAILADRARRQRRALREYTEAEPSSKPADAVRARRWRGRVRRDEAMLEITLHGVTTMPAVVELRLLDVRATLACQETWLQLSWRPYRRGRVLYQASGLVSDELGAIDPRGRDGIDMANLVEPLREISSREQGATLPLRIDHRQLQPAPWEALLAFTLRDPSPVTAGRLRFTRLVAAALPAREQRELPSTQPPAVVLLAASVWKPLAEQGWSTHLPTIMAPTDPSSLKLSLTGELVLHLIGTPVETASGWRLSVADPAERLRATRESPEAAVRGGRLVGPDQLPLGRISLVVVQQEPADLPARRVAAEREQVSELRAFAAELSAGAPAVLLLPALDMGLARHVLDLLARRLAMRPPAANPEELPLIAGELRTLVAEAVARERPDEPSWLELPLDITLFQRLAEGGGPFGDR